MLSKKRKYNKLQSKKRKGGDSKCNTPCKLYFPDEKITIYKQSHGLGKESTYWIKKDNDNFEWFKLKGKKQFLSSMFDCETKSDKWLVRIKNANDNELNENFKDLNNIAKQVTIDLWKNCREIKK